jgi:hypothetical protein
VSKRHLRKEQKEKEKVCPHGGLNLAWTRMPVQCNPISVLNCHIPSFHNLTRQEAWVFSLSFLLRPPLELCTIFSTNNVLLFKTGNQ